MCETIDELKKFNISYKVNTLEKIEFKSLFMIKLSI